MRPPTRSFAIGAVVLVLSAGCIGSPEDGTLAKDALEPVAEPVVSVLEWAGHMRVAVVYELPGHSRELADATRPVWTSSFHLDVVEAPQWLEVTLEWGAPAGHLELMVEQAETGLIYETERALEGPICMRVPTADLRPGLWPVMAHSSVAVDAELMFTIRAGGGRMATTDEPHKVPLAEMPAAIANTARGEWEPCAETGSR